MENKTEDGAFYSKETEDLKRIYTEEEIIDEAFDYFRGSGFPYPNLTLHECMQQINKLSLTPKDKLIRCSYAYKVADTYHPHRFNGKVGNQPTPVESWDEDIRLRKVLKFESKGGVYIGTKLPAFANLVNGTQACSNFRPGFALLMYRKYCDKNSVILDTSTGYGGRLIGFIASGCKKYVGIDPNTMTHDSNLRMCRDLKVDPRRIKLINKPAEDVDPEYLRNRCDFAFTSPPYFSKEHYSEEETQSWKRYPEGEDWRDGFLIPMMKLQFAALKSGSTSCLNIADVKIKNKVYPLSEWSIKAGTNAGFKFEGIKPFDLQWRYAPSEEEGGYMAREPVLIFKKP